MANPWFRLYSEFADDPKVQSMPEVMQRRLIMLFCLKQKGDLCKLNRDYRAFALRISVDEMDETHHALLLAGFLDENLDIRGWEKSQSSDLLRPCAKVWRLIRERIFERDDYTCRYCGARGVKLECDHVIPVSRGGSNDDANLTTACFSCNRSKSDRSLEDWRKGYV
ncbi:MAG TPA: HNH endonuclease [Edaphobacter sp.]|nr:HNH endonuclease [Edaphobacter sp.]